MAIVNRSQVYSDEKVAVNRKAIGHRAQWMALTYLEGLKAGADAEGIARAAISERGRRDGERIKGACEDVTDLVQFHQAFLDDVGKTTFQMDIMENDADSLKIEFHYCPLLAAWQELGIDDETCAKL